MSNSYIGKIQQVVDVALYGNIRGVFFVTGAPPKSSKYRKGNLG